MPRLDIRFKLLQNFVRTFVFRHYAATVLPPRRNGGVKAEQELLSLACLCGFLLSTIVGLLRKVTDFFLEAEESTAEDVLQGEEEDVLEAEEQQEPQGSPRSLA